MATKTKKTRTQTTKARSTRAYTSVVQSAPIEHPVMPVHTAKDCCDNCGKCENCLHPAGNMRNYTPLLMLLLLISSFLLGMFLTKVGSFQDNGLSQYPSTGAVAGANTQQQPTGTAPKSLHVAKAIGIDPNAFKKCLDSGKYTTQVASDLADGQKDGVTGTPAIFINGLPIVGAQPYSVFKQTIDQELATAGLYENIFQRLGNALEPKAAYAQTDTTTPTAATPTTPARVTVDPGKFPILGDPNAKVTVVEFADFQCPFCGQYYTQVEKNLINDYVKTGKIKYSFRNYPFLGQESNITAEGAYCANDQGKFWAYHNFLYEHQGQENSGTFSKANLEN